MKIDLLITEIHTGGAERCCTQLAIYLREKGHAVRVVSIAPAPSGTTEELLWQKLQAHSVDVHFLNASKSRQLPWARHKLLRLIQQSKPDIAQSFLWHANVLGAWCYPKHRVPVLAGSRVAEPRRWRSSLAWTWRDRVEKVVCVSQEVAQWSRDSEGIVQDKLVVIPNGIELPVDWKGSGIDQASEGNSEKILLFVGRLEEQKGIDVLLQKATSILQALPEHQLVLIGHGSWSEAWQRWVEQSPLGSRVRLLGRRADVLDWMRRSSVLLLPTRYEGMPNVVLEAMAVGLPVVSTRVEGIEHLFGDTCREQSVGRGDWDAWEKRVVELSEDPESQQRLGRANRDRAERFFNLESQMEKYELLYLGILGKISRDSNA